MRKQARAASTSRPRSDEIAGLQRALDRAYARLRDRARADWLHTQGSKPDPSDAIVSVRVTATKDPPRPASKPRRLLLPKARKPRRKVPRAKRSRPGT